jgi:hypothetical protein
LKPSADRRKEPLGAGIETKNQPKMKYSDPKREHQEHHKLRFFRGNPTWFLHRGGLLPPTLFLIETKLAHSKN